MSVDLQGINEIYKAANLLSLICRLDTATKYLMQCLFCLFREQTISLNSKQLQWLDHEIQLRYAIWV